MENIEFERLLEVCRLSLTATEFSSIKKDIDEILTYFNTLESIDTEGVEEAFHPVKIPEKTRDDTPEEFKDSNLILDNTKTYRFYVVGPEL